MSIVLNDGYLLEGDAGDASQVDYVVSGLDGTTLKNLASGQLAAAKATLYTASGVDTIAGITLFNTGAATAVNLYINDGSSRQVLGIDSLGAGYHALFDGNKLYVYDENGSLQVETTALAHKDSHDPEDGGDPLDCAAASEIAGVQAAAEGSAHTFARSDHAHQIQHGIADNHIVTVDGSPNDDEYARFTASGLEGRTAGEVRSDINVADGADVTADNAPQAHKDLHDPEDGDDALDTAAPAELASVQASGEGSSHSLARADHQHQIQHSISDNHLVTVDGDPAADEFPRWTANGLSGLTLAELMAILLGTALPENTAIILDAALSADGKYSGIVEAGTAGAILAFGDLVYFQTADSKWELASADDGAAGCNFKLGICVAAAAENAATVILLFGKVRADAAFPALTVGAPVYMGTTAGDVVTTAPSGSTDIVRIVGYGNTANELYFCPENDWITLA